MLIIWLLSGCWLLSNAMSEFYLFWLQYSGTLHASSLVSTARLHNLCSSSDNSTSSKNDRGTSCGFLLFLIFGHLYPQQNCLRSQQATTGKFGFATPIWFNFVLEIYLATYAWLQTSIRTVFFLFHNQSDESIELRMFPFCFGPLSPNCSTRDSFAIIHRSDKQLARYFLSPHQS